MDNRDYHVLELLRADICQRLNITSKIGELTKTDYQTIAENCGVRDYRTIEKVFDSQEENELPSKLGIGAIAYYCLSNGKPIPISEKPNDAIRHFRKYSKEKMPEPKYIQQPHKQRGFERYAGKYQVYWVNINKQNQREENMGYITITADKQTYIQIGKEFYEGTVEHKNEQLYLNYSNEIENFYFVVLVGKTVASQLLRYLSFMSLAVHNIGYQYSNMGLLVKEDGQPHSQQKIKNYLSKIPNTPFRVTEQMVAILEEDDFYTDEESVIEIVKKGIAAEMNAYRQLPTIYVEELELYFSKGGPAMAKIYEILCAHEKKRWVITTPNNPSNNTIYSIQLEQINNNKAIVATEEHFYLRWHDASKEHLPLEHVYNEHNQQKYLLEKQDGIWKIVDNSYPPPKNTH